MIDKVMMKTILKISILLCVLLGFSSCATLNGDPVDRADKKAIALAPRTPKTVFDEALAKNALKAGNVEIKSVLVNCYGRGIGCIEGSLPVTNTAVFLYPYTPYLQEYIEMTKKLKADRARHKDYNAVEVLVDPKLKQYGLATKTDQYGRYSFKNVKPGKYYIETENAVGHRTVVGHFYDDYGYDHPRQVDSPADLEFNTIVDITQTSGIYKFESKMNILQINGLR